MYGHHLLYSRVTWINRVRLPNLLVVSSTGNGQLNREIQCPCRYTRGKCIYVYWYSTAVCICLYTRYIFILGTCTCTVHCCICIHIYVTTAVCM